MATAQDVLNLARSQLGVSENPPGSNRGTPYHKWFGAYSQGWQWCAIFVTWVLYHVDPALFWALYTAYSGDYLNVGRMHLREIDNSQIAPGDICIWDKPIGGITDHIGFVESVTPTTFTTIEGNSGDCVRRNSNRPRVQTSSCHYYFVRPNYSAAPEKPKTQEAEMALVTSGGRVSTYAAIFQIGTMDSRPYDVWAKAQNPSAGDITVTVTATTNDSNVSKDYTVKANKLLQVQIGKDLGAKGNTLVTIEPSIPAVCTFDHRPT
jgi:hypothetical protein